MTLLPMSVAPLPTRRDDKGTLANTLARTHMKKMRRYLTTLLLAPLLLGMAACANRPFSAEVTAFHTLTAEAAPKDFILVPANEANRDSLEFASYASLVVNELQARGFRQAEGLKQSDYVVQLDYGIGPGVPQSTSVPVYGYYPDQYSVLRGRTADGKPFSARVYESGGYVPLGYTQETRTVYRRSLTLEILEAAAWRQKQAKKVYEGRAVSIGPEPELARVLRRLIQALFVDFPGPNGATRTIVLPDEQPSG